MKLSENIYKKIRYIRSIPNDFDENVKYPVIVFFHGAGSRGNDVEIIKENPYFLKTKDLEINAVTFAPQCHTDTWFDMYEQLTDFINFVRECKFADKKRIYLIGASMGGYCTWQMAMSHPEWFAAIIPICGGGMYWNGGRLKDVPVWAFHGKKDGTVFCEESIKMVEHINNAGGNAKLTLLDDVAHDSWNYVYTHKEIFDWLLGNSLKDNDVEYKNSFNNAEQFG